MLPDSSVVAAASTILRRRFDVAEVVLFGSKARGDDRQDSDIDLLMLTRGPVCDEVKRGMTDALFDLEIEMGVVFSKLVVPIDDWKHGLYRVLPIRRAVDQDGVAA
ncbi:MAG: nucleotidyltransferase domain-containing protein [Phycisphaerae bacterium]